MHIVARPVMPEESADAMLIRSLPDSSWEDAEFQREFQSRWGRESCIIWGRARRAEFGPYTHTLSIRAAWGGAEYCRVDGRTIAVDDDNFLILNHGQIYRRASAQSARSNPWRSAFSRRWSSGFAARRLSRSSRRCGAAMRRRTALGFFQNLHPHESASAPCCASYGRT